MNKTYQQVIDSPTAMLLVISNFLVFVAAFFSSLSIVHLLLIYLVEIFIILFFFLLKLILLKMFLGHKKYSYLSMVMLFLGVSFVCLFYLPFIILLSVPFGVSIPYDKIFETIFPNMFIQIGFFISILILFSSHLISFLFHFKENGVGDEKKAGNLIGSRLVLLHICLVLGVFLGIFLGGLAQGVLILFIIFKTVLDLKSHLKFHN